MKRLAFVAALMILGFTTPTAQAATTQQVGIAASAFKNGVCPQPTGTNIATVKVGDTVKWTNCDGFSHNVTWKQADFPNRTMQSGDSVQQIFNRSGFYDYYCSIHGTPTSDNMQGRVVVEGVQPSTTKATQPAPTTTAATIAPTTATTAITIATTSSSTPEETTTTTTTGEVPALESKDGGARGGLVALLLVGIAAAVGGGIYLVRRMRAEA